MHELVAQVLNSKDLSKAGDLFSVTDAEIEEDLSAAIQKIQEIAAAPEYLSNDNDQSVVEICITRITSAIRETSSIEKHAAAMVSLLDSCLRHDLKPSSRDEDPPHAKIASDLMSCIFLNYSKKSVMVLAIPVAVKFLHQGNKELSRNMSSYLSLAAIDNSKLLAHHLQPILESILNGNRALIKVLPQIYAENREPIHDRVRDLVQLLSECEAAEKQSLLQLLGLVAKRKPQTLEKHLPLLCDFLSSPTYSTIVLQAFIDMATSNAEPFLGHMTRLKLTVEQQPTTLSMVSKVIAAVGKTTKDRACDCCKYLVSQLGGCDSQTLPSVLKEIKGVTDHYPSLLGQVIPEVSKYSQSASGVARTVVQQMKDMHAKGITENDRKTVWCQTEGSVTVITVGNPAKQELKHSSISVRSSDNISVKTEKKFSSTQLQNLKTVATSTRDIHTYVPTVQPGSQHTNHSTTVQSTSTSPVGVSTYPGATVYSTGTVAAANTPASRSSVFSDSKHSVDHFGGSGLTSLTNSSSRSNEEQPLSTSAATLTSSYVGQPQAIPHRDAVQQFCDKHLSKIKTYVAHMESKLPIPIKASLEEAKHKKYCKIHFICFGQGDHCLYGQHFFSFRTKQARIWIHLMFLAIQARSQTGVLQSEPSVGNLKACWDSMKIDTSGDFVRLVTSTFPSSKDQDTVLQELRSQRFFDIFEYNSAESYWACFLCNHPEKATGILQDGDPVIEGQLKEKKGKWKFFKRWKTRYFTLSGATITYSKRDQKKEMLPVSKIQSVKAVKKGNRDIPKAFEIFTNDQTYVLKTKDGANAEQWVQALQIALARSQTKNAGKFKPEDLDFAVVHPPSRGMEGQPQTKL